MLRTLACMTVGKWKIRKRFTKHFYCVMALKDKIKGEKGKIHVYQKSKVRKALKFQKHKILLNIANWKDKYDTSTHIKYSGMKNKLGHQVKGVYNRLIFLLLDQFKCCGYSRESSH